MVLAFLVGLVIGAWCRLKGWVWLLATGAGYKGCKLPLSGSWILSGFEVELRRNLPLAGWKLGRNFA